MDGIDQSRILEGLRRLIGLAQLVEDYQALMGFLGRTNHTTMRFLMVAALLLRAGTWRHVEGGSRSGLGPLTTARFTVLIDW